MIRKLVLFGGLGLAFIGLCSVMCLAACTTACKAVQFYRIESGTCFGYSHVNCRTHGNYGAYVDGGDATKECKNANHVIQRYYSTSSTVCCDDPCPDKSGHRREAGSSLTRKWQGPFDEYPCWDISLGEDRDRYECSAPGGS